MHSHKVRYFQVTSESLRDYFSSLLEAKLLELDRVVATAQKNINEYQEGVNITNNNLTKSWFDHHQTIQDLQSKAAERIKTPPDLPTSVFNVDRISRLASDIRADLAREAIRVSDQIKQHAMQTGFSHLQKELHRVQRSLSQCDLDTLSPQDHGLTPLAIDWSLGDVDVMPEYYLARKADDLRERLRSQVVGLAKEVKRNLEDISQAIHQRHVIDRCEQIVDAAQSSLMQDLDNYFQSVKVYQAGVFAMDTKASISKLGIGEELDHLERDFTEEDKESIKLQAKQALFPTFDDVVAAAATQFTGLSERLRTSLNAIGNPQLDPPPASTRRIQLKVNENQATLALEVKQELQRESNEFISDMQNALTGVIGATLVDYDKEAAANRRARQVRYLTLIAVMGVSAALLFALITWVKQPVGTSLLEILGWGLLIEVVGNAIGFGFAAFRDNYPEKRIRSSSGI